MGHSGQDTLETLGFIIFWFVIAAICLTIYFLPFIISLMRNANNTGPIFFINLFFGWSLIGWIASFIWACVDQQNIRPYPPKI